MKYKVGDWVVFKEPLMGMESNDGFILKQVFGKDTVRRITSIDEKIYGVDNYGGQTVKVKHKDLERVTNIFNRAPSIAKRINDKHNILNGLTKTDGSEGEANEITDNGNTIRPGYYQSSMGDVFDIADAYGLDMPLGTAVKYILRAGKKDKSKEIEDLGKAIRCIERAIELRRDQH